MIEKFTFFIFCFLISRISSVPQRGYQRSHYSIINVPDNNFYTGPNYQSSYQNNYRSRNGFAQRPTANVFNVPSGADGYYVIEEVDAPNQQRPQIPNRQQTGYNSYGNQQNNYQPLPNVQRPSVAPLVTQSSCSNYWTPKNEANRKWALLRLPCSGQTMNRVKLTVSIPTDLPPTYFDDVDLEEIKERTAEDLAIGLPILHSIKFPFRYPLPKPKAIYLNDKLLCTGREDIGNLISTIDLEFAYDTNTLTLTDNVPTTTTQQSTTLPQTTPTSTRKAPVTNKLEQVTRPPAENAPVWSVSQITKPHVIHTNPSSSSIFNHTFDFECGVSEYKPPTSTGLVVGGKVASRGQYPWLAAFFYNGDDDSGFICGGSLISTKLIVTAAHCIQNKGESSGRNADEALFYIGKHNLESLSSERNYIMTGVKQFIIHPDWDQTDDRYDADIAIAVLLRTIPFSKFIKPICLWTETTSYDDIIGQKGVVVGWGKTEFSAISSETPRWTEISVVELLKCIRSNVAFNSLISDRTFCAGNPTDNSGPCNGDSGGGLVIKHGKNWFLRGIISSALTDPVLSSCDTKSYAIFTDTTKFTGWLHQHIETYG